MRPKLKMTAELMTREEAFAAALEDAKRRSPALIALHTRHTCFAVRWEDESGRCEYAGSCAARVPCFSTWRDATLLQLSPGPRALDRTLMRQAVLPDSSPSVLPQVVPAPITRQKPAKAVRISRKRPVDVACVRFIQALGTPSTLPAHWQPAKFESQYRRRGRLVISRTASFTSVLVDGVMCLRFDTTAANRARVEIVDALIQPAQEAVGVVSVIPKGSLKKSKPCTHRVVIHFNDPAAATMIDELAAAVLRVFKL